MKRKLLTICLILLLAVTSVGLTSANHASPVGKSVESLSMFKASKWTDHLRTPNIDQVENLLEQEGIPLGNPEAAIQKFQNLWAERNPTTPNPRKWQDLLDREAKGLPGPMATTGGKTDMPQIMSLVVPVEFPGTDTFIYSSTDPDSGACVDLETTQIGPLHNQIAPPGPRDNNTIWYKDASPALYTNLYFGVGPKAGLIVDHPNLGKVDLRGYTMANYYLEQSEGTFVPKGWIYPKWLQAAHSEGWYGQNSCATGSRYLHAQDLVKEVVDAVNNDNPSFPWQTFDGDGDGIVDNFTVIHAGMGQEAGGGVQGEFAIWSHASAIEYPTGKLACARGSAGCPGRDIFVREYSMDPENLDVGVIVEEYGHAAFGLPDIYTSDAQGSPSNWAIMEAGSWNGKLGGMTPAPFPLFFRMLIGWANPVVMDYQTVVQQVKVGQLSLRPKGTEQGIKINLPDTEISTPNPLGTGNAW
jgi:M6 family metalloprotease-like protein